MAKITDLAVVQALGGDETLPMVQDGVTRRVGFRGMAASMLPFLPAAFKGDPGAAGNVAANLVQLKAAPIAADTMLWGGVPFSWETHRAPYSSDEDQPYVTTVRSQHQPLTVGAWVRQGAQLLSYRQAGAGAAIIDSQTKARDLVSKSDYPIVGDGVTDDTAALTAALESALALGQALHLPGRYAVSELKFPGTPPNSPRHLHITGEPTFIQAVPNRPILMVQNSPLQQSAGHRFACTVVPHKDSDKSNPANVACDLTGFSTSEIIVRLGTSSAYTSAKGRFHTVIFARSNSPFHYGNRIRLISNNVPASKYGIRYGNGGLGSPGNPNINMLSAWIVYNDTQPGDVLLDVGDSTQTIIEGPTLLEYCPGAVGIRAGNLTTIRDVWFEKLDVDIVFDPTDSTFPNNCLITRCYFSGPDHIVRIRSGLGAPPVFDTNVGDDAVRFVDEGNSLIPHKLFTRGYPQPAAPTFAHVAGVGFSAMTPDEVRPRFRVDHHGRCTFTIGYFVTPAAIGETVVGLTPPLGFGIETATIGVRDIGDDPATGGRGGMMGLGDDPECRNYGWFFQSTKPHKININVTLRAIS